MNNALFIVKIIGPFNFKAQIMTVDFPLDAH